LPCLTVGVKYRIIAQATSYWRVHNSSSEEPAVFSIDWLRGAIPVEKEICALTAKDEAIAAAKTRAPHVAKRHSGREPDSFRLSDANGKILAIVPIRDWKR
jgi:hypothetical protein